MANELAGKTAIITGGASGIGRASVELFVAEGASVVIADLNQESGERLAGSIGGAVRFKKTDVAKREDVQSLVDFTVSQFGSLHVMMNNAGVTDPANGRFVDDDFQSFQRIIEVNLLGVMLGSQCAARHMAKHGGGSIINVASIAGTRPGHGLSTYRASKAAVINFTQSIAMDLGVDLIRANCICPGNIPTDLATYARPDEMSVADLARVRAAVAKVRMTRQPLKRQGAPADVAQAALFLGSDRSQQITGLVMPVDAGATAGDAISLIEQILEARAGALGNNVRIENDRD
jgi:NAD(P)-dependent dehydrogenase (short-subunit alcohol dehydrogenase family)